MKEEVKELLFRIHLCRSSQRQALRDSDIDEYNAIGNEIDNLLEEIERIR
jgi:hypothetical protein